MNTETIAAPVEERRRERWPFPAALVSKAMPEVERLLLAMLEDARQRLHAVSGAVWLVHPASGALICRQITGRCSRKHYHGSVKHAVRRDVGLITSNGGSGAAHGLALSEPGQSPLNGSGKRSIITMPLRLRGAVVGALQLVRSGGVPFCPGDLALLKALAMPTAMALEQVLETARLRQQVTHLQARREELDAFAQTVAHDLKNPLSLIMGYAQFLTEDYPSLSDKEIGESLQQIVRSSHKMHGIIEGLLLLASVQNAKSVQMRPLDTATIVVEAQGRLSDLIQASQAEIITPQRWPAAMGYPQWVEEVWTNYISNAVKYGGQPPRVELGADLEPDDPNGEARRVRFWVRDNGRGLSAAEQARLFTPFTQLHPNVRRGNGLGLSIVQHIVHKQGGEVNVASQPGQGSVFSFTLPAAAR